MALEIVIIFPIFFALVCALVALALEEEHKMLKTFLHLFALFSPIPTLWLVTAVAEGEIPAKLLDIIGTLTTVYGIGWFIVVTYWLLFLFWSIFSAVMEGRRRTSESKYEQG